LRNFVKGAGKCVLDINKMETRSYFFVLLLLLFISGSALAQGSDNYGSGIKINIDESGTKYVRLITWHQIWARHIENNPGTINSSGELSSSSVDIGIRRSRFLLYSQISPRFLVLTHWGINNQTFSNGGAFSSGAGALGAGKKPQIFIHDALTEYAVVTDKDENGEENPFSLHIGSGLHYWNGISRMTSASTLNFMSMDAPIYNWPNIEMTDQFARQFGIYAKGKAGKFEYRMHLNKPFMTEGLSANFTEKAGNVPTESLATGGYFEYQFFDTESNLLPFKVGSYLGTKKVFNIGAGFYHHPHASGILNDMNETVQQDQSALGLDAFLDMPLGKKGMAITTYSVFYKFDYGTNYYRSTGIMNINTIGKSTIEGISLDGFGNASVLFGTGNVSYTQAGLLLPKANNKALGRIQPYAAFHLFDLHFLDNIAKKYDLGLNYYVEGHHAKVTLQYSARPLITNDSGQRLAKGQKGEFIIQTHIYL
jgi:hypothetical protein